MPARDAPKRDYQTERAALIRELTALGGEPHPEGRVFEDGLALRDTTASTQESLRLRIRELTGLIEQIEAGDA